MKKMQSLKLAKFKKFELTNEMISFVIGGTTICTTFLNKTRGFDNFDDKSRNSSGGWPAGDLLSTTYPGTC